jgi:ribosome-associated protein YbcJ (S4-like RNA binding protein)
METINLRDDFIKLGQALKLAGLVDSGVEAKEVIQEKIAWQQESAYEYLKRETIL